MEDEARVAEKERAVATNEYVPWLHVSMCEVLLVKHSKRVNKLSNA